MKKLLTFFLTALLAFAVGWAEPSTATFEINNSGGGNLSNINSSNSTVSTGGVTLTFDKGTNSSNWPTTNSGLIRFYAGNTLTVSSGTTGRLLMYGRVQVHLFSLLMLIVDRLVFIV